jgi:hypothetical protein
MFILFSSSEGAVPFGAALLFLGSFGKSLSFQKKMLRTICFLLQRESVARVFGCENI